MKTKLFTLILAVFAVLSSNAQLSIMPKAGINLNTIDYKTSIGKEKAIVGFTGGLAVEVPLGSSKFSLVEELLFTRKGGKIERNGISTTRTLNNLEVPILARYNVSRMFYINAGPSFNFALSGKDKTGGQSTKLKFSDKSGSTDLKRFDFGVALGFGAKVPLTNGSFIADVRYNLGLTDIDNLSNQKTRTMSPAITLGYAFNLTPQKKK